MILIQFILYINFIDVFGEFGNSTKCLATDIYIMQPLVLYWSSLVMTEFAFNMKAFNLLPSNEGFTGIAPKMGAFKGKESE